MKDKIQNYLKENNIDTGIHYPISINELDCYKNKNNDKTSISDTYSKCILSLPMYPELEDKEIEFICNKVKDLFEN
jgi:dTDP-4-amino-4,6-dideoxygalactose transaminase